MQRIKRNWFRASALKKILLITGICFVIGLSFLSVSQLFVANATGIVFLSSFATASTNAHFAVNGVDVVNVSNSIAATPYTNFCLGCNSVTITGISISTGQMYLVETSINESTSTCGSISDTAGQHFTPMSFAHSSSGNAVVCAWNEGSITTTATDSITVGPASLNYDMELYVYVLSGYSNVSIAQNTATDTTCSCATAIPQLFFNFLSGNVGNFAIGAFDSTVSYAAQIQYELGTTGLGKGTNAPFGGEYIFLTAGGGGCGIYACQTSTYSISWNNQTCISSGSGCSNTTTTSTISYDSTSTVVTIIICNGNGCATRTQSTNKTVTYTDTSVSLVKKTTTATVTNTALNSPSGFSLQFWLVPLIFLMGPAFGFMGAYGSVTRERGGNVAANIAFLMFLLGLNIGALGGIILKVMPFPVLVFTLIPLCVLLYSMR